MNKSHQRRASGLRPLVPRLYDSGVFVQDWGKREIRDEIAHKERDECKAKGNDSKIPLRENQPIAAQEGKDRRVAEAAKERKPQHDGLAHKHDERQS